MNFYVVNCNKNSTPQKDVALVNISVVQID